MHNPDLYFKQIPLGSMANFVYFIGSHRKKECLVVDPAWDTDALLSAAAADEMTITGALATHYHPDHVGGSFYGFRVPGGVAELIGKANAPVHVNKLEADGLMKITGLSESDLVRHEGGDRIEIGDVVVDLLHTPGHTPGSQCFLVHDRLVSGDTLFVGGCGRVDLPGGDPSQMFDTLTNRLARLPDETLLYPGHHYGPAISSTLGLERQGNVYMKMRTKDDWLSMMG